MSLTEKFHGGETSCFTRSIAPEPARRQMRASLMTIGAMALIAVTIGFVLPHGNKTSTTSGAAGDGVRGFTGRLVSIGEK